MLYEVTRHLPWFEMSVGLIEGWERFADDLRQQDPLLKPDRWAAVLAESGFTSVEIPGIRFERGSARPQRDSGAGP